MAKYILKNGKINYERMLALQHDSNCYSQELFINHIKNLSNKSVLELGCGPGLMTQELSKLIYPGTILAVDSSPDEIALANELISSKSISNIIFKKHKKLYKEAYLDF